MLASPLVRVIGEVAAARFVSAGTSHRLHDWLKLNTDRSLVADRIRYEPSAG